MIDLEGFRSYLLDHQAELEAWGRFVKAHVKGVVDTKLASVQIDASRAKEVESAIGKIARKGYDDPLVQMTDLVGVRFVVLISPQIEHIASIIENSSDLWTSKLDRDSQEEIAAAPENFSYQSKHYVIRSVKPIEYDGLTIREGLACEVQIRTIMQHAYAEISHDSIYKPTAGKIPPQARRFVASSMALIETADHLFCETMRLLEEANRPRNQLWIGLRDLYKSSIGNVGMGFDEKLNLEVLDALDTYRTETILQEIAFLFQDRTALLNKIRSRIPTDPFWSQPSAMLAYWLVGKDSIGAYDAWPFASAREALQLVYSDLGQSLPA